MQNIVTCLLFILFCVDSTLCINPYVDFYETLNYRPVLDRRKRSLNEKPPFADLRFRSHNRTFHLKLLPIDPYTDVFHQDFLADVDGKALTFNPHEFLYEGHLKDDPTARVYGSVIDGIFDGHIILSNGHSYTVEKAARYYDVNSRPSNFHSIIYHDNDINHQKYFVKRKKRNVDYNQTKDEVLSTTGCGLTDEIRKKMKRVQDSVVHLNEDFFREQSSEYYSYAHEKPEKEDLLSFPFRYLGNSTRFQRNVRYKNNVKEDNGNRMYPVRTCTMYLQADQKFYESIYFKEGNKNHIRTREEIVGLFYNHIKAVNQIYESTDFSGIRGLNFVIQRTSIYTKDTCHQGKSVPGSDNPFCEDNVDVSNYLSFNSQRNHSAFCLAYALTFRDFVGGTLGLAWVASPLFSTTGGICQGYMKCNEGQKGTTYRSLNTGIVTFVNYGNRVPLRVSQLTMAHEIGHNFGAPHDQTAECQPGLPDGNYIMFASATSGDKVNNAKFSKCSIASISQVLHEVLQQPPIDAHFSIMPMYGKKRNCFQERTSAFCGNQIREPGEECDCGFSQRDCNEMGDKCCSPRENHQNLCRRTAGSACSPSEGLCCKASSCSFYLAHENQLCRKESECLLSQRCDGRGAACPESEPKPDGLACQDVTKVCHGGSCNGSICAEVGLKDCFLTEGKPDKLCHLACEKNKTCFSSFDLPEFAAGKFKQMNRENLAGLLLHPGSPCNNYKGYCDILRKCRSVDSNGPLARLKNLLFDKQTIKTVSQWIQEHWWACVIIGIGVLLFMAIFVKCCAVHTPSTNPSKIPAQHFSDTLRHPGTLLHRSRQVPRRGGTYSVGASPLPNLSTGAQLNGVVSNGRIATGDRGGGSSGHYQRQQRHKTRQKNAGHLPSGECRSSSCQQLEVESRTPASSNTVVTSPLRHHGAVDTRVPSILMTLPLIPPPPPPSNAAPSLVQQQIFTPVYDPPPPYTPTDPASALTQVQSGVSVNGANLTVSAREISLRGEVLISSGVVNPVNEVVGRQSTPVVVPLPGAPLPPPPAAAVPMVPGSLLPGQGPKPGRRRPKASFELSSLQQQQQQQLKKSKIVGLRSQGSLLIASNKSNGAKPSKRAVK